MSGLLLDTSLWIEALRKSGDAEARGRVAGALEEGQARLAPPVLLELYNGARGKKELEALAKISDIVPLLEADPASWERANDYSRRLRAAGKTTRVVDILIQAIGDEHDARVISLDRDFQAMQVVLRSPRFQKGG